ncbi:MAG TPA: GNAT family N-acetyltransferase [Novosphingobium sp.]|nr:GNAT family N-acetyltransferase [Novosphingobium sp.]
MVRIEYPVNLAAAQADPALAAALGRDGQRAPFDRLEFWHALADECLADETAMLAVAREDEALCALPLIRRAGSGQVRSLAHWYSFWARPVFHGEAQRGALLAALARALAGDSRRVSLAPLAPEDAAEVAAAFAAAGWAVLSEQADINHRVALAGRSFAQYWAARPGRLRETVRRKRAAGKVELRIATAFDAADWAAYESVYAASGKPAEGSPAFLRRFAESEGAAGTLRLAIATIDGAPVAAQLWTVEGGTAYIHKLAHLESAKAHSPGTLLSAAMFEHAIDVDRVAAIDFGTGDDAYKRDWMEEARPMWRLDMHRPRDPRSWPYLLRGWLQRSKTVVAPGDAG